MKLSSRCKFLTPSTTLAINALAKDMESSGKKIYNLSTGEPDFHTPENIKSVAKKAIDTGATKYTAVGGNIKLKLAIQKKFLNELSTEYNPKQITCSNGGKQILFNIFQIILDKGDEVLCFSPYWLSYKTQIELAGGKLIEVNLSPKKKFSFSTEKMLKKITPKTKAIILNSPCNPTGKIIPQEDLETIAQIASSKNLLVISDDVYEYFYYTEKKPAHILQVAPELKKQTIIVNAVSKTYAMTGWRLGYAAGPEEIIQKMEEFQSHSASNPSSISQEAAIEALNGSQSSVEKMRLEFQKRMKTIERELTGVTYIKPDGAFYVLINISKQKKEGESDLSFCLDLLKKTGVAVVPGESFGETAKGFIRISFANALDTLLTGIKLIKTFRK